MMNFTLHVRMTKSCNADCSYCSSWQEAASGRMRVDDFKRAIETIVSDVLPRMGFSGMAAHAGIHYIGGEILTIPQEEFRECVLYARERMGTKFHEVIDGVQSNLVGSWRKVSALHTLFNTRISTSVDSFGDQRTVAGSASAYRKVVGDRRRDLSARRRFRVPAIFVVDAAGIGNAMAEMEIAEREGYDLSLRPVFEGGKDVSMASPEAIADLFETAFDKWVMKSNILIQPFFRLLATRIASATGDFSVAGVGHRCPFQKHCAFVSLDLEPNGDLYVCMDMADSGQYRLGNALSGEWNPDAWEALARRDGMLPSSCLSCPYLAECQGGCMAEALHHTGDIYGKTALCPVWKATFARIDAARERYGDAAIAEWMKSL